MCLISIPGIIALLLVYLIGTIRILLTVHERGTASVAFVIPVCVCVSVFDWLISDCWLCVRADTGLVGES